MLHILCCIEAISPLTATISMSDTADTTSSLKMTITLSNNESQPSIAIICSSTPYIGEKLSKAKGNFGQWYKDMLIHLMGNSLIEPAVPHCSCCIAEKPLDPKPSWLDKAIKGSAEAAARARAVCTERKTTLQELHEEENRNTPNVIEDAAIKKLCQAFRTLNLREGKAEQIDQVLSPISQMTKIDPSVLEFEDEPRTWEEAKQSADAEWWEEGYRDELKSLKDMDIYKLIPQSDMLQGTKICKGQPVFRIKWDKNGKAIWWKVHLVFKGFEQESVRYPLFGLHNR